MIKNFWRIIPTYLYPSTYLRRIQLYVVVTRRCYQRRYLPIGIYDFLRLAYRLSLQFLFFASTRRVHLFLFFKPLVRTVSVPAVYTHRIPIFTCTRVRCPYWMAVSCPVRVPFSYRLVLFPIKYLGPTRIPSISKQVNLPTYLLRTARVNNSFQFRFLNSFQANPLPGMRADNH